MQKNKFLPLVLLAAALISGCNSMSQNPSLADAHNKYNTARSNPDVVNLAAVELKEASDTLNKADNALSKGENAAAVNQLAYVAKQQVAIAQETAKRKSAELAITSAAAKRDQIRLEARTAEADSAKQKAAVAQETVALQAEELAAASASASIAQETASQQAAALAAASANAERDQALIAQQEMQLKELNAKNTERGLVITLGDVLFSTGKEQLASGGLRNVQKLADFLKQYPQHKVLVEGYTDSTGSDSFNLDLSERRANAVRMALIDMGVSGDRVATRGYGEAFPVASNDTAASRQLNRRVEIVLSDDKGNIAPR